MSATGSTSSRGTHSRSPSRSRSPPYSDGRYPPRYSSRYDSYGYRPRSGMTAAIDDYWELRDRERERERDRSLMMRDERYGRGRYTHYYRDEPPPSHHYGPPNISRDFNKPSSASSSTTPLRRENSIERPSSLPAKAKDDINLASGNSSSNNNNNSNSNSNSNKPPPPILTDTYSQRYADWRDREWDRERDRRYRDDDRRREFDRRNRERDGYNIRESRYDSPGYAAGPPTSGYPPPPFGGDSYRPGGRDRDPPPSSPVAPHPYYDRDGRERFEDRDFYRPVSRGSSIEFDRYRNRPTRNTADRASTSWRPTSRERDLTTATTSTPTAAKPTTTFGGPISSSSSSSTTTTKDDARSNDMDDDTADIKHEQSEAATVEGKPAASSSITDQSLPHDKKDDDVEMKDQDHPKTGVEDDQTRAKVNDLHIDVSISSNWDNDSMDIDAPTPSSSSSPPLSSRSTVSLVLPQPSSTSTEPTRSIPVSDIIPSKAPSSSTTAASALDSSAPVKQESVPKDSSFSTLATTGKSTVKIEPDTLASSRSLERGPNRTGTATSSSPYTDDKPTLEAPSEPVMSQQQIVARIGDIENDITMYEDMLEEINKRELMEKQLQQQRREEEEERQQQQQQQQQDMDSLSDTKDDEDDLEEEEAAKKQALQVISEGSQPMSDIQNTTFNDSPIMRRRRPQLLMDQIRTNHEDTMDEALSEAILADNQRLAKENSQMINGWQGKTDDGWADENKWSAPLYAALEDYPCYKENVKTYTKLRIPMASYLTSRQKLLKQKERWLKREFKDIFMRWKSKNMALDRMRDQERRGSDRYGGGGGSGGYRSSTRRGRGGGIEDEPEEYVDGVIFTGNHDALRFSTDGASTPFGRNRGAWTSDAARSEAELLEIIQSLESAEMRNPEMRAKKTTATIPPMILDVKERMRTYDDRSGLVENPLVYYHTGAETEDIWTQQEMTAFMESYMQYPKQFDKVSMAVRTKTASQCVLFYYRKKTKIDFKALMRKGKRGKNRRRERLAAAIKRATGDTSTSARKGKSKGSALMADIGQAQVSRKAKEKESETNKTKELRELEEANAYWESVAERRKSKRPSSTSSVASRTVDDVVAGGSDGAPGYVDPGVKKKLGKRKGRSPRHSVTSISDAGLIFPDESLMDDTKLTTMPTTTTTTTTITTATATAAMPSMPSSASTTTAKPVKPSSQQTPRHSTDGYHDDSVKDMDPHDLNSSSSTTAKWTDKDKNAAVEAFKVLGRDFIKVAQKVATKTDDQCRNFYFNHKRKFGPNAFGEEGSDYSGTPDTIASPTNLPMAPDTMAATNGRTDLKAEEEDAAAALVGLFQMGGNRDYKVDTTPSQSPSPSLSSPSSSLMDPVQHPAPSLQSKGGRRRARTASGKMDLTTDAWTAASDDRVSSRGNTTIAPGVATPPASAQVGKRPSSEVKRGSSSSYWSVSERGEFVRYLELFGRDWTKIANYMKTKTAIQVRNFYQNNEEKMQLDKVVHRREGIQPAPYHSKPDQSPPPPTQQQQQIMPPMGTSFDNHVPSSSQHPPFPSAFEKQQQQQPADAYPGPRVGYFNPSSSARSTQVRDYPPYAAPPFAMDRHHQPPEPATGVTRVSDLLNSNDEPAETNNQNSWETWFGP